MKYEKVISYTATYINWSTTDTLKPLKTIYTTIKSSFSWETSSILSVKSQIIFTQLLWLVTKLHLVSINWEDKMQGLVQSRTDLCNLVLFPLNSLCTSAPSPQKKFWGEGRRVYSGYCWTEGTDTGINRSIGIRKLNPRVLTSQPFDIHFLIAIYHFSLCTFNSGT